MRINGLRYLRWIPIAILAVALLWYAALVFRFHTFGAIGTDPPTYVQMAVDLAQRGTVIHDFPLFTNLYDKGLSWDALITPGYRIVRETGVIAPTFAFGLPLLLALPYRVFGLDAINWTTPVLGAFSLAATYLFGVELFRDQPAWKRQTISALAVLLLATSPKQIQLALVPMSDVPAQLFCVLAMWYALRAARPDRFPKPVRSVRPLAYATLCGVLLGFAYLIRHSALVLIIPLSLVASRWSDTVRQRLILIAVALSALILVMFPDFIYRARTFGSPFAIESPDSAQLVLPQAPLQFIGMVVALFSVTGFGVALVLAPLAWWALIREGRAWQAGVLITWLAAFGLFHAPLFLTGIFENNLRYLLPAYPAIALSIAIGAIWIFEQAAKSFQLSLASKWLWLAFAILALGALIISIRALIGPERFVARAYGWMSETARRDLDSVNVQLPSNAVIGVSDQMAGATLLYTQRDIFRPASLINSEQEFPRLLEWMRGARRSVFVLGDWNCTPIATPSEELPAWLGNYAKEGLRLEIQELPYECMQRVWRISMR